MSAETVMVRRASQHGASESGASPPSAPVVDKPHHSGHRERLRERAAKGLEHVHEYELLELYLFRTLPRGDVKPLAKRLLERFGTIGGVLSASLEALKGVAGVGEAAALDLKLVHEAARRIGAEPVKRRPVVSSWTALLDYVRVNIQHEPREQFRVLFLDKKNQLIADEMMHSGTVDHAPVYPREIMRRAVELASSAVILVHNHPSGDPEPSAADITTTHEVVRAGKVIGVSVHDHLVVGRHGVVSLAQRGVLQPPPLARGAKIA